MQMFLAVFSFFRPYLPEMLQKICLVATVLIFVVLVAFPVDAQPPDRNDSIPAVPRTGRLLSVSHIFRV
jgi:hypothetical protein